MKCLFILGLVVLGLQASAQDMKNFKLYHPEEDAGKALQEAVKTARKENKNVLVQIGGNWCIWCARFHDFVTKDASIDSLVKANYVVYHMNYSSENKNLKLLERFRFPQRFGFPVFLILNGKGELLHTQNSEYLEDGKTSYNRSKVIEFFKNWTTKALDPIQYQEK